ncbi:hypothetical protein GCM10022405_01060 [Gibbsiella dentisursi]|uniref:Uncharacterized protein n=1 Tax=Gibbsiella dentisursi TaxID=796890 RepID=A0ABP7KIY0_9GAMM
MRSISGEGALPLIENMGQAQGGAESFYRWYYPGLNFNNYADEDNFLRLKQHLAVVDGLFKA